MITAPIKEFFSNKPAQLKLYRAVADEISRFGSVRIKVTKSQISFSGRRGFAWIWLPMPWDKRPKNCVVLSFALGRRIRHSRVVQAVEPHPGRWMHHVIILKKSELDKTVLAWLSEAYLFGR